MAGRRRHECFQPRVAAILAVALFLVMAVVQMGIAVGLVPVSTIWRSSRHKLTVSLRIASGVASLILLGFARIVWIRYRDPHHSCQNWPSFLVTAYMVLNTMGNWMSSNPVERYLFGSITAILAVCCFRVSTTTIEEHEDLPDRENDTALLNGNHAIAETYSTFSDS